jgi:hypothetical protein
MRGLHLVLAGPSTEKQDECQWTAGGYLVLPGAEGTPSAGRRSVATLFVHI